MSTTTQDVVVTLLANLGSRKEVQQYLRHYGGASGPKVAIVRVSGRVIDEQLDSLASSLSFVRQVGLVPVVVHGASAQLDRALEAAGIDVPLVDGLRPMTREVRETARRVLHEANARLVDALEARGSRARPFTSGVFSATERSDAWLGSVAHVQNVYEAALVAAARGGHVPVVTPLAETSEGRLVVVHADEAASALALAIRPHKIVYLTEEGGLRDAAGRPRSAINLVEDRADLFAESLSGPWRRRLVEIANMLAELPNAASVSITSPDHLAKELFTHRGAGTLVRLGERVRVVERFEDLDRDRLRELLEGCFGRRLHPRYFETKRPLRIYLSESYRATAILTIEDGVPYLDKFAVTPEAQGEGIGGSIWSRLRQDTPKLFWRSRSDNAVNDWYVQNSDGLFKTDRWWVFFCGMTSFREIEQCVNRALALPPSLKDDREGDLRITAALGAPLPSRRSVSE